MNGYHSGLDMQDDYSPFPAESSSRQKCSFGDVFIQSLAPSYPSITDELKKDVAILKTSLEIRDDYIVRLREKRDSMTSKLDHKLQKIEYLEKQIKKYQEFFSRLKETGKETAINEGISE